MAAAYATEPRHVAHQTANFGASEPNIVAKADTPFKSPNAIEDVPINSPEFYKQSSTPLP